MIDFRAQQIAVMFKPVDGGYVFRLPFQLDLRGSHRYLVNEAQKAELIDILVPKRPLLWSAALVSLAVGAVMVAALVLWALSPHRSPGLSDTLAMVALASVLIVAGLLILRVWQQRRVAPLLARLPRTDLPFTLGEMQAAAATAMPTRQIAFVLGCTVLAALIMLAGGAFAVTQGEAAGYLQLACGLVFAVLTGYWTKRLIARRRESSAAG